MKLHASESSWLVPIDSPLIGVIKEENGREVVRYFTDEEAADAAQAEDTLRAALGVVGAWSDLGWNEVQVALDRIRHESKPTPPIMEL